MKDTPPYQICLNSFKDLTSLPCFFFPPSPFALVTYLIHSRLTWYNVTTWLHFILLLNPPQWVSGRNNKSTTLTWCNMLDVCSCECDNSLSIHVLAPIMSEVHLKIQLYSLYISHLMIVIAYRPTCNRSTTYRPNTTSKRHTSWDSVSHQQWHTTGSYSSNNVLQPISAKSKLFHVCQSRTSL